MKKVISFILIMSILFMIVLGVSVQASTSGLTTLKISVKYGQTEARTMLDMINKFRTGNDAWYWNENNTQKVSCQSNALAYDYNLEKVAMQRAAEIAVEYNHTRPNGKNCFSAYSGKYNVTPDGRISFNGNTSNVIIVESIGENIAAATGNLGTAKSIFTAWQEKDELYSGQGHRRNMLNPEFNAVGVGHVYYNGAHYWVQEFAKVQGSSSKVEANDKTVTVSIEMLEQRIKGTSIKPSTANIKIGKNEKVSLPKVTTCVNTRGAWPSSNCPVIESYTWKVENTAYAKISSGKLVGVKSGKTNLVTYVRGKKVSIPITVEYAPEKVTGLKVSSQTTTSLKLSWKKTSDSTGYKVYQYDTKTKKYKKIATTKGTSYTVKKLKAGTSYKFKVVAYKTVKKKEYVGSYSSVLTTATKPATPKISKLTTKSKKATVQWKKISGASGYEICMATSQKGKYTKVSTIAKGSTVKYTKKSLKKNKKYYFKVRAYKTVNGKKVYSSYSSVKMVKVK